MRLIKSLGKSIVAFFKDECSYHAASVSFFSILSLVPFALLIITLFGYLIGENQDIYKFIFTGLTNLFPDVTEEITGELKKVIIYRGISILMLIIYGFLSLQLFYSIERAMNVIFKIPKKRHFLLSTFLSIMVITLLIFFLFVSFIATSVVGVLEDSHLNILSLEIGSAGIILKYITPVVLALTTFTVIYVIIPRHKVSLTNALSGAVFVTIMWEVAKYFFTWYVKYVLHFGAIYGSLTTFIIFLLWIYYSSCIFLLGAELVSNLEGRA